jgi:glycosyltransferase involved in cell wall biosynthesis
VAQPSTGSLGDTSEWRIDLHCHSRFSASGNRWFVNEIGLSESLTTPQVVYGLAKARGMTHVTLTDHGSIEGALRLAHHDDFIVGEEVTAYFPGEAGEVHVLVWGIDETQHAEIQEWRFNVRELCAYLRERGIACALAHPFSLATGALPADHLEELLLLFDVWEVRNGLSCRAECELAEDLVARSADLRASLTGDSDPAGVRKIGAAAGSDDRTGLDVGRTYTAITPDGASDSLLAALMQGRGSPRGETVTTAKLAHSAVALIAGRDAGGDKLSTRLVDGAAALPLTWQLLSRPVGRRLADRAMAVTAATGRLLKGSRRSATATAVNTLTRSVLNVQTLTDGMDHEQVQRLVEESWTSAMHELLGDSPRLEIGALRGNRKRLAAILEAQGLLAPYLLASGFHARQRRHVAQAAARLAAHGMAPRPPARRMPRVAMFTDTYDEINGVGTVLHELVSHAVAHDWPLTLVSAGAERRSEAGREVFPAVDSRLLDVYPGFPLALPPVLDVLSWCEDAGIEVIHAATPGPVGMTAWLLANSLDLPLTGTYHTDLPNLGFHLTRDHLLKEALWGYVRVFYDQCSIVFCPSEATRLDLLEHRVKSNLLPFPQGVDCEQFSPLHRDAGLHARLGGGGKVLLWVGRLSPEKGLDALAAVYDGLLRRRDDVRLVVVGEGPGDERFRAMAPAATCLGVKTGEELSAVYASADLFLFPGHAETFGQTVLEAAASGLPAVVAAGSGTEEALVRGVTALTVAPGDQRGFVAAIERVLDDRELHARMRAAAREFALAHSWPASFARLADAYGTLAL